MAERSLNERFVDLEDRMISVASLTRYGTANDMKFYIFDYAPKDELLVRREVKKLKSRNPEIVEFDLYEMMLDIIEEEGYLEDIQRMEAEYEKDLLLREVFQPLLSVEEDPEFPGGLDSLRAFIQRNLRYPEEAKRNKIEGKVFISFIIEADGSVSNIKVLRDIGSGCGAEAVRVVKMMPKWKPGKQRGKAVRTQFNLPIQFVLPKE